MERLTPHSERTTVVTGPRPGSACLRPKPAFTLPELMVAMVILIIVLGITGAIYKSSSDAIDQTNATMELQQRAEAIKRQLQDDLASVCKDGYLILVRRDRSDLIEVDAGGQTRFDNLTARADQVFFWRTGKFQSFDNTTIHSSVGFVSYSHAGINPVTNPEVDPTAYGDNATDGSAVNRWLLSRLNRLYVPGYSGSTTDTDIWNCAYGKDKRTFDNATQQGSSFFTLTLNNFLKEAPVIGDIGVDYYRVLSSGCGSVRVRFLMPTKDANHNGTLDANENDGDNGSSGGRVHSGDWPPDDGNGTSGKDIQPSRDLNIWLDLPESGSSHPSCSPGNILGQISNCGVVCFTPGTNLWPKALEFTVRLYDQNLTIKGMDEDLAVPREHGGVTYRFIILMPE
jgi:prepilin-type N-terminal cleavage/methylation domain-containing protein